MTLDHIEYVSEFWRISDTCVLSTGIITRCYGTVLLWTWELGAKPMTASNYNNNHNMGSVLSYFRRHNAHKMEVLCQQVDCILCDYKKHLFKDFLVEWSLCELALTNDPSILSPIKNFIVGYEYQSLITQAGHSR